MPSPGSERRSCRAWPSGSTDQPTLRRSKPAAERWPSSVPATTGSSRGRTADLAERIVADGWRGRVGAAARRGSDAGHVPSPEPGDQRPGRRHDRGRGSGPERRPDHGRLGPRAGPRVLRGARSDRCARLGRLPGLPAGVPRRGPDRGRDRRADRGSRPGRSGRRSPPDGRSGPPRPKRHRGPAPGAILASLGPAEAGVAAALARGSATVDDLERIDVTARGDLARRPDRPRAARIGERRGGSLSPGRYPRRTGPTRTRPRSRAGCPGSTASATLTRTVRANVRLTAARCR